MEIETLIQKIIVSIVDAPEQVSINRIKGANGLSIFEVKVARADTGKVIGKQGRNAAAIRALIDAASKKRKERAIIEIIE